MRVASRMRPETRSKQRPGQNVYAESASYAHVAAAVAAANTDDVVIVPAETATWASPLIITKAITLQGAGIGQTVITGTSTASEGCISLHPDATALASGSLIRVTGFTLDANDTDIGIRVYNASATPASKVRIDHNRIINTTSRAVYIIGSVFGVADNNTVETFYHGMDGEGNDVLQWQTLDRAFGSAQNFYFEDNTFVANGVSCCHAGGNGGRYVARYNSYSGFTGNISPLLDAHGNQYLYANGGHHGIMLTEFYGNSFDLDTWGAGTYFDHRGGWALFFYNDITTTNGTTQLSVREEFDDATFPGGTDYVQKVSNSYYWNNRRNNTTLLSTAIDSDLFQREPDIANDPPSLVENREFWNHNTSYNGTTEIGVFVGSSLPANCTVGDGAWITAQSASDLTGLVGANPSTPIDGVFYKCTATDVWTEYFRPYTYPHPLRNEA